jgi:Restriction endonuclease
MRSCGRRLEEYAQYVYGMLLNLKNEGIKVEHNKTLKGRSGVNHQIDVYYEFERASIKHKVAIEFKDKKRPVEKGQIQEFHSKISDLGDVSGVIISRNGYQSGAREFAAHYNILAITEEDLPTINILVGKRLESLLLPDESYIGEPFWAIMKTRMGLVTGSYLSQKGAHGEELIPLFISKIHAKKVASAYPPKENWIVRGLPQYTLRTITEIIKIGRATKRVEFLLIYDVPENPQDGVLGIVRRPEEIERDFLV